LRTDTTSLITSTYDLVGNRTALWDNGQLVQQRSSNAANQVIGWQYDAAGNLLSDGTNTYACLRPAQPPHPTQQHQLCV